MAALEGVAVLQNLGDMAQLLKMLPMDTPWWSGRAGCQEGGGRAQWELAGGHPINLEG